MDAVIYARSTTPDEAAILQQVTACRQYAQQNGLTVQQVFVDQGEQAGSGTEGVAQYDPPALMDLLNYLLHNEVRNVITCGADTLATNQGRVRMWQEVFLLNGVKLHCALPL